MLADETLNQEFENAIRSSSSKMAWRWKIFGAVLGVFAIIAILSWLHFRNLESTDDAFIDANVVLVSPSVRGQILKMLVADNQPVKKGDLLIELDATDYRLRVDQARIAVEDAQADASREHANTVLIESLAKRGKATRQAFDYASAEEAAARTKVAVAQKDLLEAELKLSYTKIFAPETGTLSHRSATTQLNSWVDPGKPLYVIIPNEVFVTANYKETQVGRIRPGQKVAIQVDAYPDRTFQGRVDSIQAGSGTYFSLFPPENATGNYVKVVQRVPVKIVFTEPTTKFSLVPGMSVVPTIEIK